MQEARSGYVERLKKRETFWLLYKRRGLRSTRRNKLRTKLEKGIRKKGNRGSLKIKGAKNHHVRFYKSRQEKNRGGYLPNARNVVRSLRTKNRGDKRRVISLGGKGKKKSPCPRISTEFDSFECDLAVGIGGGP